MVHMRFDRNMVVGGAFGSPRVVVLRRDYNHYDSKIQDRHWAYHPPGQTSHHQHRRGWGI